MHVLLDPSTVLEGDALTPVLACFEDPAVVGAGWRGVAVADGWTSFTDAPAGEVEALLGYLFAVRRTAARAVPLPPARFYRNADMEWSFLLREAGGRLVVPEGELPVRQDRHRGYHDSDPALRDRESKKTYDRFLSGSAVARSSGCPPASRRPRRVRSRAGGPARLRRSRHRRRCLRAYCASDSRSAIRWTPLTRSSSPRAYDSRK